jgi:hypothetical protein
MQLRWRLEHILESVNRWQWVAQLLVRLFVGYFFVENRVG